MKDNFHSELLKLIQANSGKGTQHTFNDNYLGTSNPRYAITAPVLRTIAKEWMHDHKHLTADEVCQLLTSLVEGPSSTEKIFAGILLDNATKEQRLFNPEIFNQWLDHLEGWAEVDALCTGNYTITHIVPQWNRWEAILDQLSTSENINKRRASLVFFCSPLRHLSDEKLRQAAFKNLDRLKGEKSRLITKAISWVLRSMVKHHRHALEEYLSQNASTLPKIAIRETLVKLKTGKKTK
jgi:3-methyladenine DNA glycosylase AlkD